MDLTPEFLAEVEESRQRLNLPADYEWYECSNECGDIVWIPPGFGDLPVHPSCSTECAMELIKRNFDA